MATAKKNSYVDEELDWLDKRLQDIKSFIDDNPYHTLKDRKVWITVGDEGKEIEKVVATIEQQQKSIRESLKDYALIAEAVSKLRKTEEEKQLKVRGNEDLTPMENGEI